MDVTTENKHKKYDCGVKFTIEDIHHSVRQFNMLPDDVRDKMMSMQRDNYVKAELALSRLEGLETRMVK